MTEREIKLEKVKITWFNLINYNDELSYDEIIPMLESLISFYNLEHVFWQDRIDSWKYFIDEMNCKKSGDFIWFNNKFNNYVQTNS